MVVEYIRYEVPSTRAHDFEDACARAVRVLDANEHRLAYAVAQGVEEPANWVVRIEWDAGLSRGGRASVVAAFGCTLGIVPHLAAAVTGTAALLRASGIAFEVVKALGVAYLLYMAWSTWRDTSALTVDDAAGPWSARRIVTSAVLVDLLNPKLTIFFFAFLPQFVPASHPDALVRMLGLSAVFMLMTFAVFALYGLCAASVRTHLLSRPAVVDRVRKAFAVSFAGLGVKLATTQR